MRSQDARPVYATGTGRLCPRCGAPADACRGHEQDAEPVPARLSAVLRLEKKGRGGKSVTVLTGLPRNAAFLRELTCALKRACGTGGTAGDGEIEIQGDQRARLRAALQARGFHVKG